MTNSLWGARATERGKRMKWSFARFCDARCKCSAISFSRLRIWRKICDAFGVYLCIQRKDGVKLSFYPLLLWIVECFHVTRINRDAVANGMQIKFFPYLIKKYTLSGNTKPSTVNMPVLANSEYLTGCVLDDLMEKIYLLDNVILM